MAKLPLTAVAWALALAALLIAASTTPPRPAWATHLCPDTGSSAGPFDLITWEALDWKTAYGRSMEFAAFNQLFPEVSSFRLPNLEIGPRSSGSSVLTDPYIPPTLLKAIAWIESTWIQADYSVPYGEVGPVLISHDCGYGIMQVTSGMQNTNNVPTLDQAMIGGHYGFNIAGGARTLADKWNLAPEWRPLVGERDPALIENWYYAVWSYNGFAFQNHPLNPKYPPWPRTPFSCGPASDGFGHDRSQYPYQELVFGCMAHPPQPDGALLWSPQAVSLPDLDDPDFAAPLSTANFQCSGENQCFDEMDIPTPQPAHQDPTSVSGDRTQVVGSPAISAPASITVNADPDSPSQSVALTIANSGSGLLAWRLSLGATWLHTSRIQGVSLGSDIGPQPYTVTLTVDTSQLDSGTHTGTLAVQSHYAQNAPYIISVTVNVRSRSFVPGVIRS